MTSTNLLAEKAMLLNLVKKGVDWDDIVLILSAFPELLKPDSWNSDGDGLLGAVLRVCNSDSDYPSPSFLNKVLSEDPGAISRKNKKGVSPTSAILSGFNNGNTGSLTTRLWWLENAPMEDLLGYRGEYMDMNTVPGASVLSLLFRKDNYYDKELDEFKVLFKRGVSPNVKYENGNPVAVGINTAHHWQVFMEAGLDPEITYKNHDNNQTFPLWEYLLKHAASDLKEEIESWAFQNRSEEIKEKKISDYWKVLKEKSEYTVRSAEVSGFLQGHPDWMSLRDEQGRNPTMYALRMNASAWRALDKKSIAPLLHLRDNDGRSLWNYAIGHSGKLEGDAFSFLARVGVSADPSPVTGRGLLADFILNPKNSTRVVTSAAEKVLFKKTTGKQWFDMPKEDELAVCQTMLDRQAKNSDTGARHFYSELIKAFPTTDIPQVVAGAIAFVIAPNHPEEAKNLMRCGAYIPEHLIPNAQAVLAGTGLQQLGDHLLALGSENSMLKNTAAARSEKTGLRL